MKYLCLAYYDEKKFDALAPADEQALVSQCREHDAALRASGRMLAVASLAATRVSRSIRPRNGKPLVTDGPYAETKEQIGAFFIVEADDLNEAAQIASKHPAALLGERVGWGVEVRPIDYWDAPLLAETRNTSDPEENLA
jgi:hypothetical protein